MIAVRPRPDVRPVVLAISIAFATARGASVESGCALAVHLDGSDVSGAFDIDPICAARMMGAPPIEVVGLERGFVAVAVAMIEALSREVVVSWMYRGMSPPDDPSIPRGWSHGIAPPVVVMAVIAACGGHEERAGAVLDVLRWGDKSRAADTHGVSRTNVIIDCRHLDEARSVVRDLYANWKPQADPEGALPDLFGPSAFCEAWR